MVAVGVMTALNVQAQSLVGRKYYNANIIASLMDGEMDNMDQKIDSAKHEALVKAERKKRTPTDSSRKGRGGTEGQGSAANDNCPQERLDDGYHRGVQDGKECHNESEYEGLGRCAEGCRHPLAEAQGDESRVSGGSFYDEGYL